MSEKNLQELVAQMKRALSEYLPGQDIQAVHSFFPNSGEESLTFSIKLPESHRIRKKEATA